MRIEEIKEQFARLEMEFEPVAIKYHFNKPEGIEHIDKKMALCEFVREAQRTGKRFYMTKEDENCCGAVALGMRPKAPFSASGGMGVDLEIYRTSAANAYIHTSYDCLNAGSVNYVEFCLLSDCDFRPDILICVADNAGATLLMRATSYTSGDLWECRSTYVMSCAWLYAYPIISGKVNSCITGMHYGMQEKKLYPVGMHIISIPYRKIDEMTEALRDMPWLPIGLREDEESIREMDRRREGWGDEW